MSKIVTTPKINSGIDIIIINTNPLARNRNSWEKKNTSWLGL